MTQGFYMNNKGCYGCKTCSVACITNRIPENRTTFMRRVTDILLDEPLAYSFISMSCNHCDNPNCLNLCPVGAYEKLENGIVKQNHELCIGCQTCISACPYGAPVFDDAEGKTYKCDMCADILEEGGMPYCVQACPGANLNIGSMEELEKSYEGAYVSDSDVETMPNFVVSADPVLTMNPTKYRLAND